MSFTKLRGATIVATVFGNTDLNEAEIAECIHKGPSTIDHRTLARRPRLPLAFLRGCGLPDSFIDYLPSLFDDAISFYSCFISYNHNDKVFAKHLHDALQGRNIRCWLDERQLLPGDDTYEGVDAYVRWRRPPDVHLSSKDVLAMPIFFIRPRPVGLLSVGGLTGNLFPVNLMGSLGERNFGFALNSTRNSMSMVRRAIGNPASRAVASVARVRSRRARRESRG